MIHVCMYSLSFSHLCSLRQDSTQWTSRWSWRDGNGSAFSAIALKSHFNLGSRLFSLVTPPTMASSPIAPFGLLSSNTMLLRSFWHYCILSSVIFGSSLAIEDEHRRCTSQAKDRAILHPIGRGLPSRQWVTRTPHCYLMNDCSSPA